MVGRSREGAWIEIISRHGYDADFKGRSREGAWIEIAREQRIRKATSVAPVRERGLKSTDAH